MDGSPTPVTNAASVTAGFSSTIRSRRGLAAVAGAFGPALGATAPGEVSIYSMSVSGGFGGAYNATLPYTTSDPLAFVTDGNQTYIGARTTTGYGTTGALYLAVGQIWTTDLRLIQRLHDTAISCFQVYKGQLYAGSWTKGLVWKVTAGGLEAFQCRNWRGWRAAVTSSPSCR